jgi:hypothetical protein
MKEIFFYPNECVIPEEAVAAALDKIRKIFKTHRVKIIEDSLIDRKDIENYSEKFVLSKVSNLFSESQPEVIFKQEIEFEKNFLLHHIKNVQLYDAFKLQEIYRELLRYELNECHIIFTHRIIATFDDADGRYHARVILLGYPNIISIAGLYYALALPKREYIKKFFYHAAEDHRRLEVEKKLDKFLLKYILQSAAYVFHNELFCTSRGCLCYDNHFFDEVSEQIKKIRLNKLPLCKKHRRLLVG